MSGRTDQYQPVEVTTRLFDGQSMRVLVPEIVGTELCRRGRIEPQVTALLVDHLRPGMGFVDVGAHYGYFSVVASRLVGPAGRVVAFEPGRETARLLEANVAHLDNVVIERAAVHAHGGSLELTDFGPAASALNTVTGQARVPRDERGRLRGRRYWVPTVSLDDYSAEHDLRPDFVKLDAEGAELDILEGAQRLLRTVAPVLIVETGDYQDMVAPSTALSIDLLESLGYVAYDYDGGLRPHRRRDRYGYGNLIFASPERSERLAVRRRRAGSRRD